MRYTWEHHRKAFLTAAIVPFIISFCVVSQRAPDPPPPPRVEIVPPSTILQKPPQPGVAPAERVTREELQAGAPNDWRAETWRNAYDRLRAKQHRRIWVRSAEEDIGYERK